MRFIETEAILENTKMKELGVETILYSPLILDLDEIAMIKPCYDSEGNEEPNTTIYLKSGVLMDIRNNYKEVKKWLIK